MKRNRPRATGYAKVKKVKISTYVLPEFFIENEEGHEFIEVTDGLPEDAELVRIVPQHERDEYWFIFESEQWEPVKEGETIPQTHVKFTTHRKEEVLE